MVRGEAYVVSGCVRVHPPTRLNIHRTTHTHTQTMTHTHKYKYRTFDTRSSSYINIIYIVVLYMHRKFVSMYICVSVRHIGLHSDG